MRLACSALGAVLTLVSPSSEALSAAPDERAPVDAPWAVSGSGSEALQSPGASADAKAPVKQSAKVEVLVLHATSGGAGIDPKLGDMPELKKPPFSSYDSYRLVDEAELALEQGKASVKLLPDKGKLTLTLQDVVRGAAKGELDKYVLNASIAKPDDKPFLPSLVVSAHAKERLFIAGQKYDKGILVIVLRVL